MTPIADPLFYAFAVPAVIMVGLAKGGFGGPLSLLGVPLMSLTIAPVQAAGIMLPILVVMDMAGLFAYRGIYDKTSLKILLPAAIVGIAIGYFTAAFVSEAHVRLLIGLVAILFTVNAVVGARAGNAPHAQRPWLGRFWGTVSGFTSFVSHAGGPPYQIYMLPLRLDPVRFAGTSVIFFTTVNAIKLAPYAALGQFAAENLATSAVLLPLAPLATLSGAWLVKRIRPGIFYKITYAGVAIIGVKLFWDGLSALIA
jgi:uncharacterized membrane protein YfcA